MAKVVESKIKRPKNCRSIIHQKRKKTPPDVKIEDSKIMWQKEEKYLGITLDSRQTYGRYIENTNRKERQLIERL